MAHEETVEQTRNITDLTLSLFKDLDELSSTRATWEKTEYQTATAQLYLLLSKTYEVFDKYFVKANSCDRVSMRKELAEKLAKDNIRITRSSSTLSLLIRYTFKSDRQRVMRYRHAIEAAKSHNIKTAELPKWLSDNGGIDAVKKLAKASLEAMAAKAQLNQLTSSLRQEIDSRRNKPLAFVEIETIKARTRSVLIAEPSADGKFSVVEVVADISDAVFSQLIRSSAKAKQKEAEEIADIQKEADNFEAKAA